MNYNRLVTLSRQKKSLVCVGLDTDLNLIPSFLLQYEDPIFEFNKQIIDATIAHTIAYKPNIAFYEAMGLKGWQSLEKTMQYLAKFKDEVFTIADAKRGDIGNTSKMYAKAFFELMDFDAITVAPYMGSDSVIPFLAYEDKWTIVLGRTSNLGSSDFQQLICNDMPLYETVIKRAASWGNKENMMFVAGATHPQDFANIRSIVPDHFLLVPGIGAQGGDLAAVCQNGANEAGGLLINSARQIIYASKEADFATVAATEAEKLKLTIQQFISFK